MATHSSILAWRTPWTEEPDWPQSMGSQRVGRAEAQRLRGRRTAERSCSTSKVRRGGPKQIPLVQGKEQRLRFAGAAVKRYPTSKVGETQVRW